MKLKEKVKKEAKNYVISPTYVLHLWKIFPLSNG